MEQKKRVKIGYLRVKEIHGILKIELIPISREEAMRILRGEIHACKSESSN